MAARSVPVLAVTGLKAEARIAEGSGVMALAGGGDAARLALLLQAHIEQGARAVVSFGIAGGLAPGFPPGGVVVARGIVTADARWATDSGWQRALVSALPQASCGDLLGVDAAVPDAAAKASLRKSSGALAVDMESHIAARLAAQYGVPFAAVRVVADPAERSLPTAALVGMRPDGSTDVAAVLRALARRPADLPGLIRTAFDAQAAFRSLKACREALGDLLGFAVSPELSSPMPIGDLRPEPAAPMGLTTLGSDAAR